MQRIQREAISEVSVTRSPSRLVGMIRLPRLRTTRFRGGGLPDDRTWRERVLSLKHRRCNEANQYHPAQQSPHENDRLPGNKNVHGRTSWDEERLTITAIILRKTDTCFMGNPVERERRVRSESQHQRVCLTLKLTGTIARQLPLLQLLQRFQ
jgi:hypothetical protein